MQLWVEGLHYFRLCWNLDLARRLADRLAGHRVGLVLDVSHVVASGSRPEEFVAAFGDRVVHVHLRDASPRLHPPLHRPRRGRLRGHLPWR